MSINVNFLRSFFLVFILNTRVVQNTVLLKIVIFRFKIIQAVFPILFFPMDKSYEISYNIHG